MTIGQLAEAAGVNVQTVRYYERRSLLPAPPRTASGYREYPASDVARLGFIRRAQGLGFTLEEIDELLSLRMTPGTSPEQVRRRVEAKIADVEARLADLDRIRRALTRLAGACEVHGPLGDCPFLKGLEAQLHVAASADRPLPHASARRRSRRTPQPSRRKVR
jgi:MerR family transcriptional regulator, copper efflux regulator